MSLSVTQVHDELPGGPARKGGMRDASALLWLIERAFNLKLFPT